MRRCPQGASVVSLQVHGYAWDPGGCDGGAAGWARAEVDLTLRGADAPTIDLAMTALHWKPIPVQGGDAVRDYVFQSGNAYDADATLFADGLSWDLELSAPSAEVPTHSLLSLRLGGLVGGWLTVAVDVREDEVDGATGLDEGLLDPGALLGRARTGHLVHRAGKSLQGVPETAVVACLAQLGERVAAAVVVALDVSPALVGECRQLASALAGDDDEALVLEQGQSAGRWLPGWGARPRPYEQPSPA